MQPSDPSSAPSELFCPFSRRGQGTQRDARPPMNSRFFDFLPFFFVCSTTWISLESPALAIQDPARRSPARLSAEFAVCFPFFMVFRAKMIFRERKGAPFYKQPDFFRETFFFARPGEQGLAVVRTLERIFNFSRGQVFPFL